MANGGGNGEVPGQMEDIEHNSNFSHHHRILVTGPSPLQPPYNAGAPLTVPLPPIDNVVSPSPTFRRNSKKQQSNKKGGPLKPMVLNDVNNSI